jgi:hypothetical protein
VRARARATELRAYASVHLQCICSASAVHL